MPEVLTQDILCEVVVPSGDGRMYRVDRRGTYQLQSFFEGKAFALYVVDQALSVHEGSVPFVHMVDILRDAELLQQEDTTDTEQEFLLQTILPVTSIELVGDGAIPFAILSNICIEEVEADTSDVDLPHVAGDDVCSVRHFEDHRRLAVGFEDLFDGELREVLSFVGSFLLTFRAKGLREVTIAVEEAHCRQADIAITGLLEVVPCQDTQTTRIDLEDVCQPVLHAEVGYRGALRISGLSQVGTEVCIYIVELGHEALVCDERSDLLGGELACECDGVTFCCLPELRGETAEEVLSLGVPYPPEVVCQFIQSTELFGELCVGIDVSPYGLVGTLGYDHELKLLCNKSDVNYLFLGRKGTDNKLPTSLLAK